MKTTTYSDYRKRLFECLARVKNWDEEGVWCRNGKCTKFAHILPLSYDMNSAANRANAIKKFLGLDCAKYLGPKLIGLHQYAHHLNSSQTLCIQFFSALIDGNYPHLTAKHELVELLKSIGITIHTGAECKFEYKEKHKKEYTFAIHNNEGKYEGTSFDFYIKDNDIEVFFEIKFTEDGFGKASKNINHPEKEKRHKEKAEQYKKLLLNPERIISLKQEPTVDDILTYYQLFRNIIRVGENKYVVFITDENNHSTEIDKENFKEKFGEPKNVVFLTWQKIREKAGAIYPGELPFQFDAFSAPLVK